MPTFRLLIEYDGSDFAGWQVQAEGSRTVQGCLIDGIRRVTGESVVVAGSGRTDAGVHAEGQVASVALASPLSAEKLKAALNGVVPRDIGVRAVERVADDFEASRGALSKLYRYRIWNARERSPLRSRRYAHVASLLDVASMRDAAGQLLGEHDFTSFRATGSDAKTSVRTLFRLDVSGESGGEIEIDAEGSGFLRHMVRNIAGTLIDVGLGRRRSDAMRALLDAQDRTQAGPTAVACGLTLVSVRYQGD
jgi:tRNA pseudouridine38-40 synthase